MERKNLWQTYSEAQIRELEEVNAQYRTCLDEGKTCTDDEPDPTFRCPTVNRE